MAAGHEVLAVSPPDEYVARLRTGGVEHRAIPLVGASVNPLRELRTVWALHRLFREEGIEAVLSHTPKGNLYGALAAIVNGLPFVPNVSGLGRVFIRRTPLTWLVRQLYRLTFGRATRVFFQNPDDMDMFVRMRLVEASKVERIQGSGVDMARFAPLAEETGAMAERDGFVFLLVARLLWDKGVGEYVEAARKTKRKHPHAAFRLLGFLDAQNPSAIPRAQVEAWVAEGVVDYLGVTDDVLPHLRAADCVVLPSYREGVPRSLLEAAAMAKPLITTDAPGCRETVEDGVTGFLCRPRDADDLAEKMAWMIEMARDDLLAMGRRGREKMAREFDERIVIRRYLDVVQTIEEVARRSRTKTG
jgi:glycosyltransferase involved in cell wall biosynthesis